MVRQRVQSDSVRGQFVRPLREEGEWDDNEGHTARDTAPVGFVLGVRQQCNGLNRFAQTH